MNSLSLFDRLLLLFMIFIGAMIAFRIVYTGSLVHLFLGWNIFLAWVPYMLSNYFIAIKEKSKWIQASIFVGWLLFFPNALYLVTDLVHIEDNAGIPVWYDAVLLFASAFIGIVMAFVSLRKVEFFLLTYLNKKVVQIVIPAILFIASFGVYLGRFQRWNSWDVIKNPIGLAMDIAGNFISPIQNYKTWAVTILFTAIFSLVYFFLKILSREFDVKK
ncbi:MAG: DUF1361 domain-containing protein [Bacteroidetes bacterium]|nr:DUF1361 domain-containing protein [Bacteroidota bacterium]MBS1758257.1 DUF1361 domain-containing protein [Bacteroidota bacterium]